jgi:hypothetical protein
MCVYTHTIYTMCCIHTISMIYMHMHILHVYVGRYCVHVYACGLIHESMCMYVGSYSASTRQKSGEHN